MYTNDYKFIGGEDCVRLKSGWCKKETLGWGSKHTVRWSRGRWLQIWSHYSYRIKITEVWARMCNLYVSSCSSSVQVTLNECFSWSMICEIMKDDFRAWYLCIYQIHYSVKPTLVLTRREVRMYSTVRHWHFIGHVWTQGFIWFPW